MDFLVLAKHGLNKTWIRAKIWSHFGGPNRRERERGEEKREEEEEEEEKKRRRGEAKIKQKGMELTLDMNYSMDHMDFVWLIACLQKLGFC